MTIREIVENPSSILREPAKAVDPKDPAVAESIIDMLDTLYDAGGAGLAAVQIGASKRVVVIDLSRGGPRKPQVFLNPVIIDASSERSTFREGCLSIPGVMVDVTRPAKVKVRYDRRDGSEAVIEVDGILATCLQHEIDHLNGILITDHGEPLPIERPPRV